MAKSRSKTSRQPVKKSRAPALSPPKSPPKAQNAAKGKWVYAFGGGKAAGRASMRNLLGGKGAGLAEMAHLGLPVPPGFTITTEVCTYFYDNGKTYPKDLKAQVEAALAEVGRITGKKFGDGENPLLVSVRSGGRASMPGMMDTVLNLGLNDVTVEGACGKIRRPALCLGQLPALHHHVFRRGARHRAPSFRGNPRRPQGPQRLHARHRSQRRRLGQYHRPLQGARRGGERQAVPAGSARAIVGRHRRGVRLVDEPARHHLSPPARLFRKAGAPRSTCRPWCSAIWARPRPPALRSRAIPRPARKSSTANF